MAPGRNHPVGGCEKVWARISDCISLWRHNLLVNPAVFSSRGGTHSEEIVVHSFACVRPIDRLLARATFAMQPRERKLFRLHPLPTVTVVAYSHLEHRFSPHRRFSTLQVWPIDSVQSTVRWKKVVAVKISRPPADTGRSGGSQCTKLQSLKASPGRYLMQHLHLGCLRGRCEIAP
jgi:hypothetical protein